MKYQDFNMREHGFVGHMAEPDTKAEKAVIVIMGGEKGLLPGIKIAERFAEHGILGLAVSLFGAEGLPEGVDRIPIDMFETVVNYLREIKNVKSISTYGMSMGSIFAALVAEKIKGIDNIIMVSPTHVPFEGAQKDKKHMTGHSMATWRGQEIPYVKPDFSVRKAGKYYYDAEAGRKVTGMWIAYRDAYRDKKLEQLAELTLEKTGARILLIAGTGDEAWPSDYSVRYLEEHLRKTGYAREYKALIYPNASHLIGMLPSKERNKWLYRLLPVIGLMYRSIGKHKKECLQAFADGEKEIIAWLG